MISNIPVDQIAPAVDGPERSIWRSSAIAVMCYASDGRSHGPAPMNFTRSVPNVVTGLRLIAVPVVVVLLLSNSLTAAFICCRRHQRWLGRLSGLNGWMVTRPKEYLDPLADKALLIAVFAA